MIKLKTLKDLKMHCVKEEYQELEGVKGNLIEEDELKQEAIKWIKELNRLAEISFRALSDPNKMTELIDKREEWFKETEKFIGNMPFARGISYICFNQEGIRSLDLERKIEISAMHNSLRNVKWTLQNIFNIEEEDLKDGS